MNIAIVDDEKKWRERTINIVRENIDNCDKIDVFESGIEFLEENKKYDVVLMDIEMPEKDGFQTIMEYRVENDECIVIILTTHLDSARRGYLVNAFRYVDKINMDEELKEAFGKIKELQEHNSLSMLVKNGNDTVSVLLKDIMYIEKTGRIAIINAKSGIYESRIKIGELVKELEDKGFYQCHKSYLVNLNVATHMDKDFVYFEENKKAYISARKYVDTKRRYIEVKKRFACM